MEDKSMSITDKRRFTELDRRFFAASASGLIAINTVILQAFISVGRLDISATISIFALAIALPMLASFIVIVAFSWRDFHTLLEKTLVATTYIIGSFSAFIAIAATLFHISWIACILFVVSAVAAYILYYEARNIK